MFRIFDNLRLKGEKGDVEKEVDRFLEKQKKI